MVLLIPYSDGECRLQGLSNLASLRPNNLLVIPLHHPYYPPHLTMNAITAIQPETLTVLPRATEPKKALVLPDWLKECLITYENDPQNPDIDLISRAFNFAHKLHEGQYRKSGEPYIAHPIAVAGLLRDLGGDGAMIAAGFLHDVVEDTEVTPEEIEARFGVEVRNLVEAVTRCVNSSCPAILRGSVVHWASRDALDIRGLGEKVVILLIEQGLVTAISDLYSLEKTEIAKLDRMGEKSALHCNKRYFQEYILRNTYLTHCNVIKTVLPLVLIHNYSRIDS